MAYIDAAGSSLARNPTSNGPCGLVSLIEITLELISSAYVLEIEEAKMTRPGLSDISSIVLD